jgi:hypothetical protein
MEDMVEGYQTGFCFINAVPHYPCASSGESGWKSAWIVRQAIGDI